jgi:hypothetical protein
MPDILRKRFSAACYALPLPLLIHIHHLHLHIFTSRYLTFDLDPFLAAGPPSVLIIPDPGA